MYQLQKWTNAAVKKRVNIIKSLIEEEIGDDFTITVNVIVKQKFITVSEISTENFVSEVIGFLCLNSKYTHLDVLSNRRFAGLVEIRQMAMSICFKVRRMGKTEIACYFKVHHSSVVDAIKKVSYHYDTEKDYRTKYENAT